MVYVSVLVAVQLLNPRPHLVKVTRGSVFAQINCVEYFECPVIGMTQLFTSVLDLVIIKVQVIDDIINQLGSHLSSVQQ